MWRTVLCALVVIAPVLPLASSATAEPPTEQEHLALLVVQKNMQAANETEKDAFYALNRGEATTAGKYLAESAQIMEETMPAAGLLTLPADLAEVGPFAHDGPWHGLGDLV